MSEPIVCVCVCLCVSARQEKKKTYAGELSLDPTGTPEDLQDDTFLRLALRSISVLLLLLSFVFFVYTNKIPKHYFYTSPFKTSLSLSLSLHSNMT
jgi:hypothetical protein